MFEIGDIFQYFVPSEVINLEGLQLKYTSVRTVCILTLRIHIPQAKMFTRTLRQKQPIACINKCILYSSLIIIVFDAYFN